MTHQIKKLSSPFSTGGGGVIFETHVQAAFVVLMLARGYAPCSHALPIWKIKLQGKYAGYNTDDLIVFLKDPISGIESKILAQIKHTVAITKNNKTFGDIIHSAWRDFNNTELFNPDRDIIALITGPLSLTDTEDVRMILEWARYSESANDFIKTKVEIGNFSSDQKRAKLEAFRDQLKKANGSDVTDDQLWRFMKRFHLLGYDLDIKVGVTLSLLHSLIGQYSPDNAQDIWRQIIEEVQSANKNAGTIYIDSFSSDVRNAFIKTTTQEIPKQLLKEVPSESEIDLSTIQFASELAIALLIGAWDESLEYDKRVIENISGFSYSDWITKIREILPHPESPLTLKNGKWEFVNRKDGWNALGGRIFDEHLERYYEIVINVLRECDPNFELSPDERYSPFLRKGLAESLALLGSHPEPLKSCSIGKAEGTANLSVREILTNASDKQWASINNLLPLLAEGAPWIFLDAVERALNTDPCPFDGVFSLESSGIMGSTYISGLLWALETLAWDPDYLLKVVVLLGELASRDPGGDWGNRPINSLTTIFLPWLPQTCASFEKRKNAIETLIRENPNVAWDLLLSLLPKSQRSSSGSHKPVWRDIIIDSCTEKITREDYWDQVGIYSELIINMVERDISKMVKLIGHLDDLPQAGQDKILALLKSDKITSLSDSEKYEIWTILFNLVIKHKKYADAPWAMKPELVEKIDLVVELLTPKQLSLRHKRLFCGSVINLFEGGGDFKEQRMKLDEMRQQAVDEIFSLEGIQGIIDFANNVDSPMAVGIAFGLIEEDGVDSEILPNLLDTEKNSSVQFIEGFVLGKFNKRGWEWIDALDFSKWNLSQIGQFLAFLPFSASTWERVSTLLGADESLYWIRANPFLFESNGELEYAVDKLITFERPNAAIHLLYLNWHREKSINIDLTKRALLAAVSSVTSTDAMDTYAIIDLIKALQDDPNTSPEDLFEIEWAYLPLLDHHFGASPKNLEQKLADDPEFFCKVIRIVFKSKKEGQASEITEKEREIAINAYTLLREWRIPPGSTRDGGYNGDALVVWVKAVEKECIETGHLDIAMTMIGQVLIHIPADPDGLWIHHSAAKVLNDKKAENIRDGFRIALLNSRGVYELTEGREEIKLAKKYRAKAEEVESYGYHRLAETLKKLAESYEFDAKRQVIEDF